MENILLYLVYLIAGYISGLAVNFTVDWLYIRRHIFTDQFVEELSDKGWFQYLIWPFIFQEGQHRFKFRALIVNLLFIVLVLGMGTSLSGQVSLWWGLPVLVYFGVVIVMDIEFRIVMHQVSITGAVLGAIVGIYLRGLVTTLIGGAVGFVVMFLLYKLGEVFVKLVNRRRGEGSLDEVALGFGDVNLAGVVGLFLGWPPIILGLLFAVFVGGLVSIFLIFFSLFRREFQAFMAIPYAPFLAIAAMAMLFFPEQIVGLLGGW